MAIIGGPALRRAEETGFYIWLVCDSKPALVEGECRTNSARGKIIGELDNTSIKPVQVGDRLFVYMLKMIPRDQLRRFPQYKIMYYDIRLDGQGFKAMGLTSGARSITYPGQALPSLFIPDSSKNILHGSCRKPHAGEGGHGIKDQFSKANAILSRSIGDVRERPSTLFLTGDQIYADDVATPLLAALIEQAVWLTGWKEILPQGRATITPADIALYSRSKTLSPSKLRFTSATKHNHLMSFGEYLAMYLVVWGGLHIDMPEYEQVKDRIGSGLNEDNKEVTLSRQGYEAEKARVENFLETVKYARRVMANLPSYMILDDHEVTDDWNLSALNYEGQNHQPLSRRILSNALAAYWVCQGWGNVPDAFDEHFKNTLQKHLAGKAVRGGEYYEATLLSRYWGYTVDGFPAAIVLDTRTRREYDSEGMPQLVNRETFAELSQEMQRLAGIYDDTGTGQSLILVSATPVYGFNPVEIAQLFLVRGGLLRSNALAAKLDAECWIGNQTGMGNLMHFLSHKFVKNCLILSGDVHYAYNRLELRSEYYLRMTRQLFQLTSSAMCNGPGKFGQDGLKMLEKPSLLAAFNRKNTQYLWPKKRPGFITGFANIGQLYLQSGEPTLYKLHYYDANSRRSVTWTYDLQKPEIVIV